MPLCNMSSSCLQLSLSSFLSLLLVDISSHIVLFLQTISLHMQMNILLTSLFCLTVTIQWFVSAAFSNKFICAFTTSKTPVSGVLSGQNNLIAYMEYQSMSAFGFLFGDTLFFACSFSSYFSLTTVDLFISTLAADIRFHNFKLLVGIFHLVSGSGISKILDSWCAMLSIHL